MKPHPKKAFALTTILALAGALTACGGGGGDDSTDSADTAGDPIDKYMVSLTSSCDRSTGVVDATTGAAIYQRRVLMASTKVSATKATGSNKITYFDTSDCSGNARYTLTLNGSDNYLEVTGNKVVGGQTADKVKLGTSVYFPGISFGTSFTLNSLKFTGAPYNQQTPLVALDLLFLDASGNLYDGDASKPLDADGYPTALGSAPAAKKS